MKRQAIFTDKKLREMGSIQEQTRQRRSDETNPEFLFGMTHTTLLLQIAKGQIDPMALAKKELANRGMGKNGEWIGFDEAGKLWNT